MKSANAPQALQLTEPQEKRILEEYTHIAPRDAKEAAEFAVALARLRRLRSGRGAAGQDPLMATAGTWKMTREEEARMLSDIEEMRDLA